MSKKQTPKADAKPQLKDLKARKAGSGPQSSPMSSPMSSPSPSSGF